MSAGLELNNLVLKNLVFEIDSKGTVRRRKPVERAAAIADTVNPDKLHVEPFVTVVFPPPLVLDPPQFVDVPFPHPVSATRGCGIMKSVVQFYGSSVVFESHKYF